MTIRSAIRMAWATCRRQLPDVLRYSLLTLVIHLMPLAPALALLRSDLYPALLLCPALYVLLVLPMRQNAARVMQHALRGGRLFDIAVVSFRDYGRQLAAGLRTALVVCLWALPGLALTGAALYIRSLPGIAGQTDGITLLIYVRDQFGGGSMPLGLLRLVLLYLASWLPLCFGCAFHSGARHARALGRPALMRRRRGRQLLCWLAAQCTLLPWLAAAAIPVGMYVQQALSALQWGNFGGLLPSRGVLLGLAAVSVLLLPPVLPLRDLIIAAMPVQLASEEAAS